MVNDLHPIAIRIAEVARARAVAVGIRLGVDRDDAALEECRPRVDVLGALHDQAEMIELVESEPDILAVPAHPRSVRYYANPGRIFPRFELRRLLSEAEGDVRVTYRQHGALCEATRNGDRACPAELFEPLPWYLYKSLWFRRQVALTGPMHCTQ